MTMPDERTRALTETRAFLEQLQSREAIPNVPDDVRDIARWLLRHYPTAGNLHSAHLGMPHLYAPVLGSKQPDELAQRPEQSGFFWQDDATGEDRSEADVRRTLTWLTDPAHSTIADELESKLPVDVSLRRGRPVSCDDAPPAAGEQASIAVELRRPRSEWYEYMSDDRDRDTERATTGTAAAARAFERLLSFAERSGTNQTGVVSKFIASVVGWTHFDLYDLRRLDSPIADDILLCIDGIRWGRCAIPDLLPDGPQRALRVSQSIGFGPRDLPSKG
ncbi:BPSL0761 family protein [Pseudorhodoferax sp. Leaf265]|uniref:BPSL0761 family protein n=1 Tax=Pseudorhodoferax sp. Leaf265 TaxID=1736315 RepID=UPI0007016295|nr:BPSL0761 family protein [Pseudorhodoferax sp. Leaf265]KQP15572.1 hypothetical protein ASF45_28670 [Pseudorhodoferax sp. Leaf265]